MSNKSRMSKALVRRETIAGYAFMLPSLIFFFGFVIYPMVQCVITSFFDSTMNREDIFIGFGNYIELFQDKVFLGALRNTVIIVVVSVPVVCVFSLWVSSVIHNLSGPLCSIFRCIFYLPVVTGSVAVTVVWKWMFNNYYGIFNYVGKATGLIDQNINWLGDERYALGCIILILLTTSVGQPIVLYVSALNNVDQSLVEAAQDLGANTTKTLLRVLIPMSVPGISTGITMVFVPAVSTFVISRMLGGGTELLLGDLIERQFLGGAYNPQLGAAISLVMMIIVLVCMLVMNRFGEGEEQAVKL